MALASQILASDTGEQFDLTLLSVAASDYRNTQNPSAQNQTQPIYDDGAAFANDELVIIQPAPAPSVAYTPPAPIVLAPQPVAANDAPQTSDQSADVIIPAIAPVIAAPIITNAVEHHNHPHHRHDHTGYPSGYLALKVHAPTHRFDQPPVSPQHSNNLMPPPTAQTVTAAIKNLKQYAQTPHVHFEHLNPAFVILASRLVTELAQRGDAVTITSAFRTAKEQDYLRHHRGQHGISNVVARGTSNHQRGLAMDIRTNYGDLAQAAINLGLIWGGAFNDKMHISMLGVFNTQEERKGERFAARYARRHHGFHNAGRILTAHNRRPAEQRLAHQAPSRLAENTTRRPGSQRRRHLAQAGVQPGFAG